VPKAVTPAARDGTQTRLTAESESVWGYGQASAEMALAIQSHMAAGVVLIWGLGQLESEKMLATDAREKTGPTETAELKSFERAYARNRRCRPIHQPPTSLASNSSGVSMMRGLPLARFFPFFRGSAAAIHAGAGLGRPGRFFFAPSDRTPPFAFAGFFAWDLRAWFTIRL